MTPEGDPNENVCRLCRGVKPKEEPRELVARVDRNCQSTAGPSLAQLRRRPASTTPANFVNAIEALESLAASPFDHRWLVLWGRPGAGKTQLLKAARAACHGLAAYITATELARRIAAARMPSKQHDIVGDLSQVPILLLDDLGFEPTSREANWALDSVISRRYNLGLLRPTVVATALGEAALDSRYPRQASRCLDVRLSKLILLDTPG
jgi:DNA replication protein DnaC